VNTKRKLAPGAILAAGVLALSACTDAGTEEQSSGEVETVKIVMGMASGDTFTAEWWGWLAAEQLGYYDELGIDVEFVAVGGSGDVVEQLVAGNVDAGNPSMPAVGEGILAGLDLINLYTYSTGAIFGIFAPADSGITSIADLAGKKIGISEPGGGEVAFLEASLIKEGIDPITGATLIPIGDGGPETFAAIEGGQVDAYSTAYNDIFALQTQGLNLVDLTPAEFKTFPARGIITTSTKLAEKGEAWGRFAQGTAMGTHFCLNNNDACIEMLKGVIPAAFEENMEGVSQGALRFALSLTQVPPVDPAAYGAHNEAGTKEFLALIGSTIPDAKEIDLAVFLNRDYLEIANQFDRTRVEKDAADY